MFHFSHDFSFSGDILVMPGCHSMPSSPHAKHYSVHPNPKNSELLTRQQESIISATSPSFPVSRASLNTNDQIIHTPHRGTPMRGL